MRNLNRRSFLATSLGAASALSVGKMSLGDDQTQDRIPSSDAAKFKFSLAAYSYRDLLTGDSPQLSLFDFVNDCAKFGLEGTELTSYYFPKQIENDYLTRVRRHCFRQGLDVSGTAIRNDFGFPAGEQRDLEIAHTKAWIEHAARLGAPVIRIFAGHQQKGIDAATSHRLMVDGIAECCDYAGKFGIHLALENHGGPTATADGLLAIVNDVKSPWFGVNLDSGNFRTDDPYIDITKVAPHAINVQVKVVIKSPNGELKPMDFRRLASILQSSKYRGYVVLEYEEKADPRSESERYLEILRNAFA